MSGTNALEFQTTDLGTAAFLLTRGLPLLGISAGDGRRSMFHFPESAQEIAHDYYRNAPVPARAFFNAIRDLKATVTAR